MSDEDNVAPARKRPVAREHFLQSACRVFARDAIDVPPEKYQFLSFDSAQKATDNQRARMVARGVLPGTWDAMICIADRLPIWTEFKHGSGKLTPDQNLFGLKMSVLGHGGGVARSVRDFMLLLKDADVPLRRNAELIAEDLDLKVKARIARAEIRLVTPGHTRSAPRYTLGKRAYRGANAKQLV